MAKALRLLLIVLSVFAVVAIVINNYSFVFARTVEGQVFAVEKSAGDSILGAGVTNSQIFSYAVAVKDPKTGEIVTASSEDRQWGVAPIGYCVKAKFYPYPPWNLEKGGTYFNARLQKLYECAPRSAEAAAPVGGPVEAAAPKEPSSAPAPAGQQ